MAKMIPHFWDHLGWLYSLTSILAISTALMRPRRPKQYCLQVNPSSVLVLSPIKDVKRITAFFFAVLKRKPVKTQACTGLEPLISLILVQ